MTAGPLLVPMHLDAMTLNVEERLAVPFRWFQLDYDQLRNFNAIQPGPFAGGDGQPAAGVYLHWTLPRPLRHGRHDPADGSTSFPPVPNRWAVVRIQHGAAAATAVKAWIVESDHTAPEGARKATSAYVDPAGLDASGLPLPIQIGRSYQLTPAVTALGAAGKPFLTAVGPGSAHFALFAPGVQDVFGLYDDVSDPGGAAIAAATFTYHVAGWYADPATDPLAGAEWAPAAGVSPAGASVDDRLGLVAWLGGGPGPTAMLVHGLTAGVAWDRGAENPQPPSYPVDTATKVKVAFGNTALDALGAIVRLNEGSQAEADLLEAFGYGVLDELDRAGSAVALDTAIRRHWFSSTPCGTAWTVVAPEPAGSTALPTEPPAPLTSPQAQALARLNAAQFEQDRVARLLAAMRWRLYSLWWKQAWLNANPLMAPVDDDFATWLQTQLGHQVGLTAPKPNPGGWYVDQVTRCASDLTARRTAVQGAATALDALLDPATQVRKEAQLPQYHAPDDPVLVATALGRSTNLDPVGDLTCRLPAQTVTALTVDGRSYSLTGDGGQAVAPPPLADPHALLPAAVQALHAEALFLSASLFAQDVLGDPARASDVARAIAALPGPSAAGSFAPAAGSHDVWAQPWVPLLLDWEVTALARPAYVPGTAPVHTLARQNWTFDGTDFRWSGPTTWKGPDFNESDSGSMTLQGRTFITPQVSFTLAARLDDWVRKHSLRHPALEALLKELDAAVDALAANDVLSQRLSGLRSLLVQRDDTPTAPASGPILAALGDQPLRGFPRPYPDQVLPPVWDFAPMAGTFIVVNRLSVIDFMGRTVDLMLSNWSQAPPTAHTKEEYWFYPIASAALRAPTTKDPAPANRDSEDPTPRMLMLPPRLGQDAQLWLRLSANDGSDTDVDLVPGGDAVCGWLVPNHLDRSIVAYAPDGTPWGELFLAALVGGAFASEWWPDPTNPAAPASVDAIPNQYVREMLSTLAARSDGGAGFADLLATIDTTLATVDTGGSAVDEDLSVLVGRPLAVVRAQASLRLRGLAPLSQDWWTTFAVDPANPPDPDAVAPLGTVDGGMRDLTWPVRLGDAALRGDGLVGYFVDDPGGPATTYAALNAVTRPAAATSDYVKQIGDAGNYVPLRPIDDTVVAPDPARHEVARLTLLLDPRGSVHAFTGLLPVTELALPPSASAGALAAMAYLFRAGPVLATPDALRVPRPAEHRGTWEWFDRATGTPVPVVAADDRVQIAPTPAVAREGWLRFTPAPPKETS